ncbi:MAG: hypothetical protein V1735_06735 [Nanoarchaeota archaeon]
MTQMDLVKIVHDCSFCKQPVEIPPDVQRQMNEAMAAKPSMNRPLLRICTPEYFVTGQSAVWCDSGCHDAWYDDADPPEPPQQVTVPCGFCAEDVKIPEKIATLVRDLHSEIEPRKGRGFFVSKCGGVYCSLDHYVKFTED